MVITSLTKREREWMLTVAKQAKTDSDYMARWQDDPNSTFTRGIIERHNQMAQWVTNFLKDGD